MAFRFNPIELGPNKEVIGEQYEFVNIFSTFPERYQKEIRNGWGGQFRTLMPHIKEGRFACLYSDDPASRPNSPVNRTIMGLLLKEHLGLIDDDLRVSCVTDMNLRYALCMEANSEAPFSDNTFTRFRQACIRHYIDTGEDLIHEAFMDLTSYMAEFMEIDHLTQIIDSSDIKTWSKDLSRMDLLYINNERFIFAITGFNPHKRMPGTTTVKTELQIIDGQITVLEGEKDGTEAFRKAQEAQEQRLENAKKLLPKSLHGYLDKKNKNITMYHSEEPYASRVDAVIRDALALYKFCEEHPEYKALPQFEMFDRIFHEQCTECEPAQEKLQAESQSASEGNANCEAVSDSSNAASEAEQLSYRLRGKQEGMHSGMIQSPLDPDATFRSKDGKNQKGYTIAFTEAKNADGETLIMDYEVDRNNVSDQDLGKRILENMESASPDNPGKLIGDSLFNSPEMQELASEKNIVIVNTNLTGKKPCDHCADHVFDENGVLTKCAGGAEPIKAWPNSDGSACTARFEKSDCEQCPFRNDCKVQERLKFNTLHISASAKLRAEQIRERGTIEFSSISYFRNSVETVPSQLKNSLNANQIRSPGLPAKRINLGIKMMAANVAKYFRFTSRRMVCAPT